MKSKIILAVLAVMLVGGCDDYMFQGEIIMLAATANKLAQTICILVTAVRNAAGAVASLVFVFAGVKWIASQENPKERKEAKDVMIYAIVGLVMVVAATSIVSIMLGQEFECSESAVTLLVPPS